MLRVRGTGHGLNDTEVAAAMEPFRNVAPSEQATDSQALLRQAGGIAGPLAGTAAATGTHALGNVVSGVVAHPSNFTVNPMGDPEAPNFDASGGMRSIPSVVYGLLHGKVVSVSRDAIVKDKPPE